MGPRPFSRGRVSRQKMRGTVQAVASMGPRPFSRGRPQQNRVDEANELASMGPRPFSRGRGPRRNPLVAFGLRRRFREVVPDEGSREAPSTCPFCKHCTTNGLRMREVPGVCTPQDLSKQDSRKKTRYTITARRSGTFTRGSPQNSMHSSPRAPAGPRSITITRS